MSLYYQSTDVAYSLSHITMLKKYIACFKNTPIDTFCYLRCYLDGTLLYLSNNDNWLKNYIHGKYYNYLEHTYCYTANDYGGFYTWCANDSDYVLSKAKDFGIYTGINLCLRTSDFCEVFAICSSSNDNNIVNYYMNNKHSITEKISSFRNHYLIDLNIKKNALQQVDTKILNKLKIYCENYNRVTIHGNIKLSYKALSCLYWLCQGKSAYETGLILGISNRTVEAHIDAMRIKMNCNNKTQLVYKILSMCPDILHAYHTIDASIH